MKEYEVTFTVKFHTFIQVPEGGSLSDECASICIPDTEEVQYVGDSFQILQSTPINR